MEYYFENYARQGNIFLKKVAVSLGTPDDIEHAFRVLQALFYAVRDRITPQESLHFISQLPMAIKSLYVNNWKIHEKPKKYATKEEFLNEVYSAIPTREADFGINAEEEVQAVFRVLSGCISKGEMSHVKNQLTPEIAELLEI